MKTNRLLSFALFVGVLAVCAPMFAHHGNVAYDNSKLVVLKDATVTKVNWGNPHTLVLFDAKDGSGKLGHWVLEADSAHAVSTSGWTKDAVQPGDVITVYLYQAKSGALVGRAGKLVTADGHTFGNGNLFDQQYQCDKDFTPGGSASAACRPDGRKTQTTGAAPSDKN